MARETATGGRPATSGVIAGGRFLAVGKPGGPTPDGFSWRSLSSLARLESGHTPSRKRPEYWNGEIPWVGIRDATENHGRTLWETKQTITQDGLDNSSTRLLPARTVCLSRTASVGYVVVMGVPMCTSQDFVNWVCGPELDYRYLSALLRAEQATVRRFAHGTTHQTVYFPEAKAFHILVPDIDVQDRIAVLLGAIDDKIESNRRAAHLISALVRAEFRAEEAHADGVVPLATLASFTKGVSYRSDDLQPSGTALVTLKSFLRIGGYTGRGLKPYLGPFKDAQRLEPGDLALAQTDLTQAADVVGRVVRVPSDPRFEALVASLDLVIVRGAADVPTEFLFGLLQQEEFRAHCRARTSGTTVLHLASDAAPSYLAPNVNPARRRIYAELVRPLLERLDSLDRESRRLESLRDGLLPELMSGRIRVPDAFEAVEETIR